MIYRKTLAAAAALSFLSAPVFAEGWSWSVISNQASIDQCKSRASESFDAMAGASSRSDSSEGSQTIYAYNLGGNGVDSVVYCIRRGDGSIRAVLITHSIDGADRRRSPTHTLLRAMMRDLSDD